MWDDAAFRTRLLEVEIELKALEMTQMRVIAAQAKNRSAAPDPASSILKIKGSQLQQATTQLLMELAGPAVFAAAPFGNAADDADDDLDWARPAAPTYMNYRKVSIYGGSNEIQRNVIARGILGL